MIDFSLSDIRANYICFAVPGEDEAVEGTFIHKSDLITAIMKIHGRSFKHFGELVESDTIWESIHIPTLINQLIPLHGVYILMKRGFFVYCNRSVGTTFDPNVSVMSMLMTKDVALSDQEKVSLTNIVRDTFGTELEWGSAQDFKVKDSMEKAKKAGLN